MKQTRKKHSPVFKAKVALAVKKERMKQTRKKHSPVFKAAPGGAHHCRAGQPV